MTTTFNIWNIRSKTLRAIVAWLFAALAAVVVLLCLVPALIAIAIGALVGMVKSEWPVWRDQVVHPWWRAATGKEAV